MKKLIVSAVAAAAMTGAAHAAAITTTSGSGDLVTDAGSYQVYEEDGVTMTLSAGLYLNGVLTPGQYGANPTPYSSGTGISHNQNDGQHTIDSWYPEVAILAFDTTVQLTGAVFSYVDWYDTFDIWVDSNNDGMLDDLLHKNLAMPDSFYAFVDLTALNLVGKLFGIGASDYEICGNLGCKTKKPDWKLKRVKLEDVPDVPVPAALPLFLAGVAGLGFATRRKKSV